MNKIICVLILCLSFSSCSDWLRVDPYDRVLEKDVFKDKKTVESSLNGIYLKMAGGNLYGNDLTARTVELLAQQYFIKPSFEVGVTEAKYKFYISRYNFSVNQTKNLFATIWSQAYNVILDINNFIKKLDETPTSVIGAKQKDILLGEAYALRAYIHLDLLRLFGPIYSVDPESPAVPYRTVPKAVPQERNTASEVMDSVLVDINRSLELLENDPVRTEGAMSGTAAQLTPSQLEIDEFYRNRNRRLNYYAAQALKVRALMYKGDKAEAGALAKELVVSQKLTEKFPWVKDPYRAGYEDRFFSSEVLFGIHSYNMYSYWNTYFNFGITNSQLIYSIEKSYMEKIFDTESGAFIPDIRSNNFKTWTGADNEKDELLASVRSQKSNLETTAWNYQPLIRKSELFYAIAEAENNVAYLDSVRLNRGIKAVADAKPSYDLLTETTNEYIREFKLEGQLFFYYKRIFATSIQSATSATSTVSMSKNNYVLPVPEAEIDW